MTDIEVGARVRIIRGAYAGSEGVVIAHYGARYSSLCVQVEWDDGSDSTEEVGDLSLVFTNPPPPLGDREALERWLAS